MLDADPHCLRWELARGVEERQHYGVRIEWNSLTGYEQGFRVSPAFADFVNAVRPFFGQIEEMKHYQHRLPGSMP